MHADLLVLATANTGKLKQFQSLLAACNIDVRPQDLYGVSPVEETGLTFVENAILKARHAAAATGLPALADDSGLEVDHLQGAPGIYSARFAGEGASDADNNRKLLEQLAGVPAQQRTARYQCVLAYMRHASDPTPIICQAAWEGLILEAPAGDGGFGYDPIFYDPRCQCSSAQMDSDVKSKVSHRGQAMAQLLEALRVRR